MNKLICSEKHTDMLLCSIKIYIFIFYFLPDPYPRWAVGICRCDVFIYLRAPFRNKIQGFYWAFAQLLLLKKTKKKNTLICSGSEKEAGRGAWCRALISQVGWMHNSWALKLSADCSRADTESPSRTRLRRRACVCVHTWASESTARQNYGGTKAVQRLKCVSVRQNGYLNNGTRPSFIKIQTPKKRLRCFNYPPTTKWINAKME